MTDHANPPTRRAVATNENPTLLGPPSMQQTVSRRIIAATILLLGGCAAQRPDILSGPHPADPRALSSTPKTSPVDTGNTVAFPAPVGDWGAVNRRVTPGAERSP